MSLTIVSHSSCDFAFVFKGDWVVCGGLDKTQYPGRLFLLSAQVVGAMSWCVHSMKCENWVFGWNQFQLAASNFSTHQAQPTSANPQKCARVWDFHRVCNVPTVDYSIPEASESPSSPAIYSHSTTKQLVLHILVVNYNTNITQHILIDTIHFW